MAATDLLPPHDAAGGDSRGAGLEVRPFRGLRYDPARVSDLAAVTSPPYDVIDPDGAHRLEQLDPHNVVRLVLPGAGRHEQAGVALEEWLAEGVLVQDEAAALYVYEQRAAEGPGGVQRGLIGCVGLRGYDTRVILPHEDVMPGPVEDRLRLMRATRANLEPILLVYDGGGRTAQVLDRVCASPPLLETVTEQGLAQRLWAVTDPDDQQAIADDLRPRQALIADGHHRYATYLRLQQEHRAAGDGAGPWDYGLALLVDARTHPLQVGAIHRVVAGLGLPEALDRLRPAFRLRGAGADLDAALHLLEADAGRNPFLVGDGTSFVLADEPDPDAVEQVLPHTGHSEPWRSLDASVLHALVLDRLWAVDDSGSVISYVHDAATAVREARRQAGVAVLLRPVPVSVVADLAARGERMPRKSTSFGPKPRNGLVLRRLDP